MEKITKLIRTIQMKNPLAKDSSQTKNYAQRVVEAHIRNEHSALENMKTPIINLCESFASAKDFELHVRNSFSKGQM